MTADRKSTARRGERRNRPDRAAAPRRQADAAPTRTRRRCAAVAPQPAREARPPRSGPQTATTATAQARPAPPKSTQQAKARAKARKAKAPKVVRVPLRERLIARLAAVDLRPRTLAAKVPFVVLIIGALGLGLGITLWLSTDAAERSYQLGNLREKNRVLLQQKEGLERDVLTAQSAPALAEAARNLGMIPTRDTAHLIQDPVGNWVVVGDPKPAEGAPPPPLNTKLPDEHPAPAPAPPQSVEVPVRLPQTPGLQTPGLQTPGLQLPGLQHLPAGAAPTIPVAPGMPGPPTGPLPGPLPGGGLDVAPPVAAPQAGVERFTPPLSLAPPAIPDVPR